MVAAVPVAERFWTKVDFTDTCWLWTAGRQSDGYGAIQIDNRSHLAHRYAYQEQIGPVPEGKELDHLCRNRRCVNPSHLEPVTHMVNARRGEGWKVHGLKTHCPKDHPYDEENTYVFAGWRGCKQCRRDSKARYLARKKAGVDGS